MIVVGICMAGCATAGSGHKWTNTWDNEQHPSHAAPERNSTTSQDTAAANREKPYRQGLLSVQSYSEEGGCFTANSTSIHENIGILEEYAISLRDVGLRGYSDEARDRHTDLSFKYADSALSKSCLDEAEAAYKSIINFYVGGFYAGIRDRARVGLDDVREARRATPPLQADKVERGTGAEPTVAFPAEAMGFKFLSSSVDSAKACTALKHQWTSGENGSQCSGAAVKIGLPVETSLKFCEDELCEVRAFVRISKDKQGDAQFEKLRKALIDQYGMPTEKSERVAEGCGDGLMLCFVESKASWQATWRWGDGSLVRAKLVPKDGVPIFGVLYRLHAPGGGQQIKEEINTEAF